MRLLHQDIFQLDSEVWNCTININLTYSVREFEEFATTEIWPNLIETYHRR